jgi:hypothetical protein
MKVALQECRTYNEEAVYTKIEAAFSLIEAETVIKPGMVVALKPLVFRFFKYRYVLALCLIMNITEGCFMYGRKQGEKTLCYIE